MFEFEYEDADAETRIILEFNCLESLSTIFCTHDADRIEDVMYMFTDAVSAILVALQIQDLVEKSAQDAREQSQPTITVKGYGVHLGDVLFFPGTDRKNTEEQISQQHKEEQKSNAQVRLSLTLNRQDHHFWKNYSNPNGGHSWAKLIFERINPIKL